MEGNRVLRFATAPRSRANGGEKLKPTPTMTPQKRERYAQWLRKTGVENPSNELINQTQKRALLQIHQAEGKAQRYKLKLIALTLFSIASAIYIWFKL
jgi:hypothetical protein